jgi:hypothetical protein
MNVQCSSQTETEPGDLLNAAAVKSWLEGVPDGAIVSAIIRERGTQRDPEPTLVGLRAAWSETR